VRRCLFLDVEAWGRTAEVVEKYAGKGKLVTVDGRLEQQRWEKDGQKRSKVIVVASGAGSFGPKTSAAGEISLLMMVSISRWRRYGGHSVPDATEGLDSSARQVRPRGRTMSRV
jgi:single-strand DNA-binding protein